MAMKKTWPLWSQISLVFIIVTVLVTYAAGELIRQAESKRLFNLAQTQLDQTFSAVSATVLDEVITEDIAVLETVVEQLATIDKQLYSLKIVNESGNTLIDWHKASQTMPKHIFPFEKTITYEGENFGVFRIERIADDVYKEVASQVNHARLLTMGALLTLAMAFSMGIHLLVIRPLRILDERLLGHASGKTDKRYNLWAAQEFQHVNNTINQLQTVTTSKRELEKEMILREKAETELILARDEALLASKAKSQFLANMSHELRTPLNAIIGYSELIKEDFKDGKQSTYHINDLDRIEKSGKHLLSLINDVLDLSKIEAKKMELFLEQFSLVEIIEDIVDMTQPLIQKNHNSLEVIIADDIHEMKADITKIRQILFNLVSNASKFTEHGKISINVNRSKISGIDGVSISVSDTGIGIGGNDIQKLFQPFSQIDTTNTREYGGTGLGLVLARQLCHTMGGEITIESEKRKGTTFTVWLPLVVTGNHYAGKDHEHQKAILQDPETLRLKEATDGPDKRKSISTILIIDDDPDVRNLMSRTFNKEGFHTAVATDGLEGIAAAKKLKPQLITLDIMMPKMDGWAVLKELKEQHDLASIPVIIVSIIENKLMAYELGAVDSISKPIEWKKLIRAVQDAIRN